MANIKPLILASGKKKELGATDTVATNNLGTGTANASTFLRGDQTWATPAGGGSANIGTATVNFGAFPGTTDTSIAVTGQAGIVSGSFVDVRKRLITTADHSPDEHFVEEWDVEAGNIIPGTGFTIYARTRNKPLYGQWNVAFSWS